MDGVLPIGDDYYLHSEGRRFLEKQPKRTKKFSKGKGETGQRILAGYPWDFLKGSGHLSS